MSIAGLEANPPNRFTAGELRRVLRGLDDGATVTVVLCDDDAPDGQVMTSAVMSTGNRTEARRLRGHMSKRRPRTIAGLEVLRYKLADDEDGLVVLETRGPGAWVICYPGSPACVRSKCGEWRHEVAPSNRTEEFKRATRYPTPEAAYADWLEHLRLIEA